jgi:ribosome modulation factor
MMQTMIEAHSKKPILFASAIDAEGFEAGLNGDSAKTCPYEPGTQARDLWFNGWQDGHASRVMAA